MADLKDVVKVVKGLKLCREHGTIGGKNCRGYFLGNDPDGSIVTKDVYIDQCPYGNCKTGCVVTMVDDAVSLLLDQAVVIDQYHQADTFLEVHGWKWKEENNG